MTISTPAFPVAASQMGFNQYQRNVFETLNQFRIAHTLNRELAYRRRLIFEPLCEVAEGMVVMLLPLRLGEVDLSVEVAVLERP